MSHFEAYCSKHPQACAFWHLITFDLRIPLAFVYALHNSQFIFCAKPVMSRALCEGLPQICAIEKQLIHCGWICKYKEMWLCAAGTLPIVEDKPMHFCCGWCCGRETKRKVTVNIKICLILLVYNPLSQYTQHTWKQKNLFQFMNLQWMHITAMQQHQNLRFFLCLCVAFLISRHAYKRDLWKWIPLNLFWVCYQWCTDVSQVQMFFVIIFLYKRVKIT